MTRSSRVPRLLALGAAVGLVVGSCGGVGDDSAPPEEDEAAVYFTGLARAYSANDYYRVLDFYAPDAFRERWRGSVQGGALIRDLLRWNSGDLGHEVVDIHIGSRGALNLIRWDKGGGLTTLMSSVGHGRIAAEVAFDHGAWLEAGLRTSPEIVRAYEALYVAYAKAWSDDDGESLRDLYASEVELSDTVHGAGVSSLDALSEMRQFSVAVEGFQLAQEVNGVPVEGLAVFLGPADFGVDPERAVGLYTVTDREGCKRQVAVAWDVDGGDIVAEERFEESVGLIECYPNESRDGWWVSLDLPGPSDEFATGRLGTGGGYELEIFNGTTRLEQLLSAGFDRFAEAGLVEPRFDSVTFEPTRRCQDRSGRLLQDEDSRELFLCFFESDICGTGLDCDQPLRSIRVAVLHELAHAWIIDNVGTGVREEFMGHAGLTEWEDDSLPWSERGVEYAAEVVAWGLLDESASMARIGRPSCESLRSSFRLLTGVDPLRAHDCDG
jgi:hypothetical protein